MAGFIVSSCFQTSLNTACCFLPASEQYFHKIISAPFSLSICFSWLFIIPFNFTFSRDYVAQQREFSREFCEIFTEQILVSGSVLNYMSCVPYVPTSLTCSRALRAFVSLLRTCLHFFTCLTCLHLFTFLKLPPFFTYLV